MPFGSSKLQDSLVPSFRIYWKLIVVSFFKPVVSGTSTFFKPSLRVLLWLNYWIYFQSVTLYLEGKPREKRICATLLQNLFFLCYLCFMSNSYIFVGVFFCPHVCLVYLTCCFSSTLIVLLIVVLGLYLNIWLASTHVHLDFALSVNYRNLCT